MVAHAAHSFARKTKFRNQKEAIIPSGNEVMIKLRNFQSENSLKKFDQFQNPLRLATGGLQTRIAHRQPTLKQ